MPWRGPSRPGEFPTLGYLAGRWIESQVVIPDGPQKGEPYLLTAEMWRHCIWRYRLKPDARPHPRRPRPIDGFVYSGTQLRRPQKWGKDPFMDANVLWHMLGFAQFDGWDADGHPVGRPVDTPRVQVAATSEDQVEATTWRPLLQMIRLGPLIDTPGLDVGDTRIVMPGGDGWAEPVTSSARSRLGNPITMAAVTEPHLMRRSDGGLEMWRNMRRGLTGMGGTWMQVTNNWDPTEKSVAQQTAEAKRAGVFLDFRGDGADQVDLADEQAVRERIRVVYGDSLRTERGGWVDEDSVLADVMATDTGEAEARRFFLDEQVVGSRPAVDLASWDAGADTEDPLRPGEQIVLGFDGSRARDATALVACRLRDGKLFHLRTWLPTQIGEDWRVDRVDVDRVVTAAFTAYDVLALWADPFRWQDYLDVWAGRWPKRVIEVPTNQQARMDKIIERFLTALRGRVILHNGNATLTEHALNATLRRGKRKAAHEMEGEGRPDDHYLMVTKKKPGALIDAFIAALLAYAARGQAIEDGALVDDDKPPPPAAVNTAALPGDGSIFRPGERLNI